MQRIVRQELPDGTIRVVHPFHISMEGLETAVLYRDDQDYDAMVKILCGQNSAEIQNKLIAGPRKMQTDGEFFKQAQEASQRWFQTELATLSQERKIRLVAFLHRTTHTTVPQLARVFGLTRETVSRILGRKGLPSD